MTASDLDAHGAAKSICVIAHPSCWIDETAGPAVHLAGTMSGFTELGWRISSPRSRLLESMYRRRGGWLSALLRGLCNLVLPLFILYAGLRCPGHLYVRHYYTLCPAYWLFRALGRPFTLEVNATLVEEPRSHWSSCRWALSALQEFERRALRQAHSVTAVSGVLRERLVEQGLDRTRVFVVHNGADVLPTDIGREKGAPAGILYVGNFKRWHRIRLLLRAFAQIKEVFEDDLILVGSGDKDATLALADELRIGDRVRVLGPRPHEEVWRHMKTARVLVLPHTETYGSPLKLFEYLASGTPTVAPDLPNIREVVGPGRSALLFHPGSSAAMAAALRAVVEHPELAARLGANGRSLIAREFSWVRHAQRVASALGLSPVLRLLVIGSLPPPVGGTTVLLRSLVEALRARPDVSVDVVNTSGIRRSGVRGLWRLLCVVSLLVGRTPCVDVVSSHVHLSSMHLTVPAALLAARFFRKPFLLRLFGGKDYRTLPPRRQGRVRRVIARADAFLVESRALVRSAEADGIPGVKWYPNSRPMPPLPADTATKERRCERFVFVGHIRTDKGIRELLEAASQLRGNVVVDVYGTLGYDVTEAAFSRSGGATYRGALPPGNVLETLGRYDALVLPTYHEGEGYPGVVLEAYAAGLPVIATCWGGLPEIVDESTGILVPPRDPSALAGAMKALSEDPGLYTRLREGVLKKRMEFAAERWTDVFVEYCREVASGRA